MTREHGVFTPATHSLLLFITLCALTLRAAWGDAVLEVTVGGDNVAFPGKVGAQEGCRPCVSPPKPGDTITIHVAGDRIRRDRGPLSIILDRGRGKVYFLCSTSRQYSKVAYPANYAKVLATDFQRSMGDLLDFTLSAPGVTQPGQVKNWKVQTFEATVANGLRNQYRVQVAVVDDLPGGMGLLLEFRKVLLEIEHAGHGWSHFLPFTTGVPVVWEERERQPETEFVYREEVTKIDVRPVGATVFEVPKTYTEIEYVESCFSAR